MDGARLTVFTTSDSDQAKLHSVEACARRDLGASDYSLQTRILEGVSLRENVHRLCLDRDCLAALDGSPGLTAIEVAAEERMQMLWVLAKQDTQVIEEWIAGWVALEGAADAFAAAGLDTSFTQQPPPVAEFYREYVDGLIGGCVPFGGPGLDQLGDEKEELQQAVNRALGLHNRLLRTGETATFRAAGLDAPLFGITPVGKNQRYLHPPGAALYHGWTPWNREVVMPLADAVYSRSKCMHADCRSQFRGVEIVPHGPFGEQLLL